ncbi:uncharacterized protein BT62DRAFT_964259 [Guyanagaster necrorhizus]|uniref:UBC core domain-containing protein n=1 Tax=Guyanagaster necrorhizus TaxID=856835 RepID=A0A9P7VXA0_9AGAR|nr:uncharacterized protein BT62DRAFT_964259 [Guyanagaster necrorhizus MCA 3950]KAG7449236.1 hypothetical protein BT62DRAFT_964259 [Guyanagaster necrorhizus MCA 3950]
MEKQVEQLVEMGASQAQARAALTQYKDVMEAAEHIFEGNFDDVTEDNDVQMVSAEPMAQTKRHRMNTPDEGEDEDILIDDEDDEEEFVDYDSDYENMQMDFTKTTADVDPYSGIFFSKDRREEVIEVGEDPESTVIDGIQVKIMTQGEWMKGCPEGGEQSFLFALYSQLTEGQCPCPHDCGTSIPRSKGDFFAIFPDFPTYIEHLRKIIRRTCAQCRKEYCYACGESISTDKVHRPSAATDDNPLFHCSNMQGVILGVGISMLEQMFVDQINETTHNKESKPRSSKRRKPNPGKDLDDDDDIYYTPVGGKRAKGGTGYAGDQKEDNSGQVEAQAIQQAKDERIGGLLTAVRVYLPSLRRLGGGQTSDYLVHPTALAHLRRRFNHVCSVLLRNDSLADMSERSVLYFELLEWLETISNHEALASMMAMPIMAVASVKASTPKKGSKSHIRERTIVYEGSSSPRELLEGIVIQAQAALKGLEGMKLVEDGPKELTEEEKRMTINPKGKAKETEPVVSEENQALISFCRRILSTTTAIDRSLRDTKGDAFVDRLHASLPKILTSSSQAVYVEAGTTEESAKKAYLEWATSVRFEYCDLTLPSTDKDDPDNPVPHYKFYFNQEARNLANMDIPKRSLAIAKELAILTANLPVAWDSSIFLRVDETRVDIIKVLITGPEGTPYYNGCFLFDIFLVQRYNEAPPSVKYMTTGGGKYRFNPNLYADGKVCLSLLGTWTGPGWVSGKSTLLQVLISIQSMILCDEPYLNEPGWASSAGTPQSQAYSANVRRMVVKTAMLGNLKNPPEPFEDIIRTHFRLKARTISAQLDQWLAMDDGKPTTSDGGGYGGSERVAGGSSNGFKADCDELKAILKDL